MVQFTLKYRSRRAERAYFLLGLAILAAFAYLAITFGLDHTPGKNDAGPSAFAAVVCILTVPLMVRSFWVGRIDCGQDVLTYRALFRTYRVARSDITDSCTEMRVRFPGKWQEIGLVLRRGETFWLTETSIRPASTAAIAAQEDFVSALRGWISGESAPSSSSESRTH